MTYLIIHVCCFKYFLKGSLFRAIGWSNDNNKKMDSRQVECFLKWNLWQESLDIDPSSLTLNRPYKRVSFQNNSKRITEWTWTQKRKMARLDMFDCVALYSPDGISSWDFVECTSSICDDMQIESEGCMLMSMLLYIFHWGHDRCRMCLEGIEHSLKRIQSIVTIYTSEKWFSFEFLQVKAKSHGKLH